MQYLIKFNFRIVITSKTQLCIPNDLCRIQIVKEGKKRKLVINGAKMEDAGKITAKTNADETSCDLGVKRKLINLWITRFSLI